MELGVVVALNAKGGACGNHVNDEAEHAGAGQASIDKVAEEMARRPPSWRQTPSAGT